MGKHQLRLLRFAIRYPGGWHTFGKDRATVAAVYSLARLGFLELSEGTRQFRLALSEYARNAVDSANCKED